MLLGSQALVNDPYYNDVVLLLRGYDAPSGQVFKDYSKYNRTITANGNVAHSTTQKKYGNSSIYFDGNGDYLTVPASTDFAFGTGDFAIDGWFYATINPSSYGNIIYSQTISGINYFVISAGESVQTNPRRFISFIATTSGGGTPIYNKTSTEYNLNTWNHFCIIRKSGVVTVYLNGEGGTPTSNTINLTNTTYIPTIGRYSHGGLDLNANIEDLRITRRARDIVVPTQPFSNW